MFGIPVSLSLLCVRVAAGIPFVYYGYQKMLAGETKWLWLGNQLGRLDIFHNPMFWGMACTYVELFGGVALMLGLCTHLTSLLLTINMLVAVWYHLSNNDQWSTMAPAVALLLASFAIFMRGPGVYSVDAYLKQQFPNNKVIMWLCS